MRVLLIDDHPVVRYGILCALRECHPQAEYLQASSSNEAKAFASSAPDLVLLDLKMPGERGLDSLLSAKQTFETAMLVVLSSEDDPEIIQRCIESGAAGYIPKSTEPEVIRAALALVLSGGIYLPPHALRSLSPAAAADREVPLLERAHLSPRQREAFVLAVQGKSNKIIARELDIAVGTVGAHLSAAYRAIGVRDRVHAVIAAASAGLSTTLLQSSSP